MRVLFVINALGSGGTERSAAELVVPLSERGVDVAFVCLESLPGVEADVRASGADVDVVGTRSGPVAVREVRRRIRSTKPDVVHTALFESDVFGRLAAVASGTPVLGSLVNASYEPERLLDPNVRRAGLEIARVVDGWTGRHLADHFHAVSESTKQSALRRLRLDPSRITVVERGRDRERLGEPSAERRLRVRKILGIHPEAEVLLSVGRHEYQKDQLCLVEAMARLTSRSGLCALVAGRTGNASADLEAALASSPAGDRVSLLGHRDDIPDILAAADIFVCTSRYEGLPGAVIEAMALGLPVVATSIPPVHEVVDPGVNAALFPVGDAAALAASISDILDDRARRAAMGERSREIFLNRFTLGRSADRMAELYERVATSRRRDAAGRPS